MAIMPKGKPMKAPMLDHAIITEHSYDSFKESTTPARL